MSNARETSIGHADMDDKTILELQELIVDTGALAKVEERISLLVDDALLALSVTSDLSSHR